MITLTDSEIVARFKIWKKINGWSYGMISMYVGCSKTYVKNVVNGKSKPSKRIVKEFSYLITSKPVDFSTLKRL